MAALASQSFVTELHTTKHTAVHSTNVDSRTAVSWLYSHILPWCEKIEPCWSVIDIQKRLLAVLDPDAIFLEVIFIKCFILWTREWRFGIQMATDFCYIEVLWKRNELNKIKLHVMHTISETKAQELFSWYVMLKDLEVL